jgi:uncharacterized protein YceK
MASLGSEMNLLWLLDIPCSFALDTVTLPITITATLGRDDDPPAKSDEGRSNP